MPKNKPKLLIKQGEPKSEDLQAYIIEANQVKDLANHTGWQILQRDLLEYQNGLSPRLAYLNPKTKEFYEARILFIAVDKIFSLINDYKENREAAVDLLNKLENPDLAVTMDYDPE